MTQKGVHLKEHESIKIISNILTDDCGCWPSSNLIASMDIMDTVSTEWEGLTFHVSCTVG